jgi:hypothetical protein
MPVNDCPDHGTACCLSLCVQAKQKLVQAVQERNALQQDVHELQQKYAQKSR